MSRLHHRFHLGLKKKKRLTAFDAAASVMAIVYPLCALPQVLAVFRGRVDGVSVASWLLFAAFSVFFLAYGLVHRVKPMIFTYGIWIGIDLLVAFGTLAHHITT